MYGTQSLTEKCGKFFGTSSTYRQKVCISLGPESTAERMHDNVPADFSRAVLCVLSNSMSMDR
jgi:hypothetical protein